MDYGDLTQYSYTVEEVAALINRQPRYVWDRYIIGLALIQNWSGHSFMSSFEESRISRYDLIRFLVDQRPSSEQRAHDCSSSSGSLRNW